MSATALATAPATAAPAASTVGIWKPAQALASRELVRFFRQKGRVIGALGTPLLIWLFFGLGMGERFQAGGAGGAGYLTYFFPGMIAMIVLFTTIFSAIGVIQDRTEGFLQAVLVAPVPRVSIVLGKIGGGALIAILQGLFVLALAPWAGIPFQVGGYLLAGVMIVLMSVGLSAVGFLFAWGSSSVQAFHGIMNLVLFPMWLLSGSFFPGEGIMGWVMAANPLTYGVAGLRRALFLGADTAPAGTPALWVCLAVSVAFAVLTVIASAWRVSRPER